MGAVPVSTVLAALSLILGVGVLEVVVGYDTSSSWRNGLSFVARYSDGSLSQWGSVSGNDIPVNLTGVKRVYSSSQSYAAIYDGSNSVTVWGNQFYGGGTVPLSSNGTRITYVSDIYSTSYAFAAIHGDERNLVSWGDNRRGGGWNIDQPVKAVAASVFAFAALTDDGNVLTTGPVDAPPTFAGTPVALYSTSRAFGALMEDGTVQAWGSSMYGGSGVPATLANVTTICTNDWAMAALQGNGSVMSWGESSKGGTIPIGMVNHVSSLYSTKEAFAALRLDGTVYVWGNPGCGGGIDVESNTYTGLPAMLSDVEAIYSTTAAFCAVSKDGRVQSWGSIQQGGSGAPLNYPSRVRAVTTNAHAMAAVMEDGTVQTWGDTRYGGGEVPRGVQNVQGVFASIAAFAALNEDGTVLTWGSNTYGGSGGPSDPSLPTTFSSKRVEMIFGTRLYTNPPHQMEQKYPCPLGSFGQGYPECAVYPTSVPSSAPSPSATPVPTSSAPSSTPTAVKARDNSRDSSSGAAVSSVHIIVGSVGGVVLVLLGAVGLYFWYIGENKRRAPTEAASGTERTAGVVIKPYGMERGDLNPDPIPQFQKNPLHRERHTAAPRLTAVVHVGDIYGGKGDVAEGDKEAIEMQENSTLPQVEVNVTPGWAMQENSLSATKVDTEESEERQL